jgi:hypothetical protein
MLIAGTPPPGHIGVVIPLNPLGKGVFQGQTLAVNQLAIIGQQSEIQYTTPDDLRMLVVTLPVSRLNQSLVITADRDVDPGLAQSRLITLNKGVLADIEATVSRAIRLGYSTSHQDPNAIGPDIGLMVDTNCAWDEAQAIAAARSMRDLDLMMIEEPVLS